MEMEREREWERDRERQRERERMRDLEEKRRRERGREWGTDTQNVGARRVDMTSGVDRERRLSPGRERVPPGYAGRRGGEETDGMRGEMQQMRMRLATLESIVRGQQVMLNSLVAWMTGVTDPLAAPFPAAGGAPGLDAGRAPVPHHATGAPLFPPSDPLSGTGPANGGYRSDAAAAWNTAVGFGDGRDHGRSEGS
jgi:hypothetical protein